MDTYGYTSSVMLSRYKRKIFHNKFFNRINIDFVKINDHAHVKLTHQSTGFVACCKRYGDFSSANRLSLLVLLSLEKVAMMDLNVLVAFSKFVGSPPTPLAMRAL